MCIRDRFDKGGVRRKGALFLTNIVSFEYSGTLDRYGNPVKSRQLQRTITNTTIESEVSVEIDELGPPYSAEAVAMVDVSGDGFWEPVATFGDWDRWFVRDRPGVPGFD